MARQSNKPRSAVSNQYEYASQNAALMNPGQPVAEPYIVYSATLTQVGTDAPTDEIARSTFRNDPTFSYDGVGDYTLTLSNSFPTGKTFIFSGVPKPGQGSRVIMAERTSKSTIRIRTSIDGAYSDNLLNATPIKIEVYLN